MITKLVQDIVERRSESVESNRLESNLLEILEEFGNTCYKLGYDDAYANWGMSHNSEDTPTIGFSHAKKSDMDGPE